jgi:hypothetical protein
MLAWVVIDRQHPCPATRYLHLCEVCVYVLSSPSLSLPHSALSPIFRTFFQVLYLATPLFATLTKTAGVYTNNSHSGTRHSSSAPPSYILHGSLIQRSTFKPSNVPTAFSSITLRKRVKLVVENRHYRPVEKAHFAQFWCNVSAFRMNTCKNVSKERTLSPFRMNTYKKHRGVGGEPLLSNYNSDEGARSIQFGS